MTADTSSSPSADDLQASITSYWNLRSPSYDVEPGHNASEGLEMDAWVADVGSLLPPPPLEILDVGAGTGFVSTLLARLGYRVTGLDPSQGMLSAARARGAGLASPPAYIEGDGHAPPFPPESFDAVTNRHVLWTLRNPRTAFAAWLRVLRPGGRLLAIDSLWFANSSDDSKTILIRATCHGRMPGRNTTPTPPGPACH
jgi:ubiquinone/menaquinone biosynthesis C-methylase UbiE